MSAQTSREGMEDDLLAKALPCPFCGCVHLRVTDWWDDDGEYPAIECFLCKGSAPAAAWNRRTGLASRDSLDDTCLIGARAKWLKGFMEKEIASAIRAFNRETGLVVDAIEFDPTIFEDDPEVLLAVGEVRTRLKQP